MTKARQMIITQAGGPEVFAEIETEFPAIRDGDVLIRTHFAGVNFADILTRMGMYPDAPPLPLVVGYEVSGEVLGAAADVEDFVVGDRVVALTRFGGYSSHVSVPARQIRKVPDNVSLESAAALPVTFLTAHLMLHRLGGLMAGDTVLVHNAGGGVGTALVSLAKLKGAHVIATASRGKHEMIRDLGAREVIDYNQDDFVKEVMRHTGGRGVDLILDAGGPVRFERSYQVLAPLGKLVMYGVQSSVGQKRNIFDLMALGWNAWRIKFRPVELMNSSRGIMGLNVGRLWNRPEQIDLAFNELIALLVSEAISPEIAHIFTYIRAGDAHAYIQSRQNFGKVLLDFRAVTQAESHITAEV